MLAQVFFFSNIIIFIYLWVRLRGFRCRKFRVFIYLFYYILSAINVAHVSFLKNRFYLESYTEIKDGHVCLHAQTLWSRTVGWQCIRKTETLTYFFHA